MKSAERYREALRWLVDNAPLPRDHDIDYQDALAAAERVLALDDAIVTQAEWARIANERAQEELEIKKALAEHFLNGPVPKCFACSPVAVAWPDDMVPVADDRWWRA